MNSNTTIYIGRFVKAAWMFSIIFFLVILLYVYTKLPSFITLTSNFSAADFLNFQKSDFFYWVLFFFIISNVSWYLISKKLASINYEVITKNSFMKGDKVLSLVNWLNSFSLIINILVTLSVIYLGVSTSESKMGLGQISIGIYFFLGLIVLWFLLLAYLLIKKEKPETDLDA